MPNPDQDGKFPIDQHRCALEATMGRRMTVLEMALYREAYVNGYAEGAKDTKVEAEIERVMQGALAVGR